MGPRPPKRKVIEVEELQQNETNVLEDESKDKNTSSSTKPRKRRFDSVEKEKEREEKAKGETVSNPVDLVAMEIEKLKADMERYDKGKRGKRARKWEQKYGSGESVLPVVGEDLQESVEQKPKDKKKKKPNGPSLVVYYNSSDS